MKQDEKFPLDVQDAIAAQSEAEERVYMVTEALREARSNERGLMRKLSATSRTNGVQGKQAVILISRLAEAAKAVEGVHEAIETVFGGFDL